MNEIMEYSFGGSEIRAIVDDNGEPWFVAKDVCATLDIADTSQAAERLSSEEKLMRVLHVSGQRRKVLCINESGLYALIFSSRKPEAKAFRVWVTSEVLPAIRKTGEYKTEFKRVRDKSKKTRFEFTDMLKAHGCNKPGHYIQITKAMKDRLGIDTGKKKAEYDYIELSKTTAAEMVSAANIMQEKAEGYKECREISENASAAIEYATRKRLAS